MGNSMNIPESLRDKEYYNKCRDYYNKLINEKGIRNFFNSSIIHDIDIQKSFHRLDISFGCINHRIGYQIVKSIEIGLFRDDTFNIKGYDEFMKTINFVYKQSQKDCNDFIITVFAGPPDFRYLTVVHKPFVIWEPLTTSKILEYKEEIEYFLHCIENDLYYQRKSLLKAELESKLDTIPLSDAPNITNLVAEFF